MRISARADYAVRAVAHLALRDSQLSQISDIARDERIPAKFLEHILIELKKAGVVSSKRGVGGGYSLARLPEEITVGEVIRIFDGTLGPVGGLDRMQNIEDLTDAERCLRTTWLRIAEAIAKVVDGVNFEQVAAERRNDGKLSLPKVTQGTAWF